MPKITYFTAEGEHVIEDAEGDVMSIAVENGIEGIAGDCGGVCSCATCHVHVDPAWLERAGTATDVEQDTLEFEEGFAENSRLGCQVELTPELDGLVVRVVGKK